jgi:hypothetical protein
MQLDVQIFNTLFAVSTRTAHLSIWTSIRLSLLPRNLRRITQEAVWLQGRDSPPTTERVTIFQMRPSVPNPVPMPEPAECPIGEVPLEYREEIVHCDKYNVNLLSGITDSSLVFEGIYRRA